MVFLYIYLGTVVLCFGVNALVISATNKEVKNRGYKYKEEKKNIAKSLISFIKYLGLVVAPVYNCFLSGSLFFKSDKFIENAISSMIEDGDIVKAPKDDEDINIKEERFKALTYNTNNELTREEKIKYLKQELHRLTGKDLVISVKSQKSKTKQKRR